MTAQNKKRKCKNTLLDRGGEKGKVFRLKGAAMYHKKERKAIKWDLSEIPICYETYQEADKEVEE